MDNRILIDTLISELEDIKRYATAEHIEYYKGQYISVMSIAAKFRITLDEDLHMKLNVVWNYINELEEHSDEKEI